MEIDPNIPFGNPLPASQRLDPSRCVDLIVLGINYRSNEEDVRQYFQQFGELVFCEVSRTSTPTLLIAFDTCSFRSNGIHKVNRVDLVLFVSKIMNHNRMLSTNAIILMDARVT